MIIWYIHSSIIGYIANEFLCCCLGIYFMFLFLKIFKDRHYLDKEWGQCFPVSICYNFVDFFFICQFYGWFKMYKFCYGFFFFYGFLGIKKKNTFGGKPFYIDINTHSLSCKTTLNLLLFFCLSCNLATWGSCFNCNLSLLEISHHGKKM